MMLESKSPQGTYAAGGALASDYPIAVRDLNLSYKTRHVLKDVNLQLPHGAVVGLVGANGAGKTTLIRSLLGLTLPQSGESRLLGEDSGNLSDNARARLGYVAQTPQLIDWMKVAAYLDYIGAFYPSWDERRVAQLLQDWGLSATQKIVELSPGQRQKLALVQALGHAPELLLLDEPVASLDPLMRRDFMRTLFDDVTQRTVLISSHLLSDLERIITHLIFMKEGKIVLFDEWDVLAENLHRVQLASRLPDGPGVLAQHMHRDTVTAVVDARRFDLALLPPNAQTAQMNLDAMFVELMS
jgi:ABC-2 type transport system ATP-binding protein